MNNVADKLYNILGTKFNNTDIKTLDSKGKETTDMEEIEMFSFDFLVDSKNYGPVVILLSAEENLEVYYGDNTSKTLDRTAKKKWENLIEHLSTFARTNRMGFSLKHTTDLKYDLSNITDITESYRNIFEGYYGTSKTSYSPQGKAKIIIKHSKTIGEDDKRFRNISQIFIENADGERFKLPFKKLAGARAMARHVTEGGNPYDLFGVHISEMVNDINTLGGFVRRSKMYEGNDEAMGMVETGRTHYNSLRKDLKQISGVRGYKTFKENWEPSAITEMDADTTAIRSMFMNKKVNQRTEDALPLLARLQQMAEAHGEMDQAEKIGHEENDMPFDWDRPEVRYQDHPEAEEWEQGMDEAQSGSFVIDTLSGSDSARVIDILNKSNIRYDERGSLITIHLDRESLDASTIMSKLRSIAQFDEGIEEAQNLTELTSPEYRGFKIKFSKVPGKKLAARATSKTGAFVAGAHGKNEAAAMEALKVEIDDYISGLERVTGKANINLNVEFTTNHLRAGEDQLWCKFEPGPLLVVAGERELKNEDTLPGYLRGEGFTKTGNRKKMASETANDLLGFGINPNTARESQAIANGRYTIADATQDKHGNKVYSLDFDSVVTNTNEKKSLGVPGLTVATARGIGEAIMDDSSRPSAKQTYVKIKDLSIMGLKGYARRIGMTADMIDHDADVDFMIDEIMGFLYDDDWERNLVTTGGFNEMDELAEFEQWADSIVEDTISEGTWAVPETPEDLRALMDFLAEPQPMGIDGMNVTDALYDIIGDDELFDTIADNAEDAADMDARVYVIQWIEDAIKNKLNFTNPAVIRNLQKALDNAEVDLPEGLSSDLDADDSTQLNASINKHVDQYAKSKKVTESVDLNDLMKLTNRLIRK